MEGAVVGPEGQLAFGGAAREEVEDGAEDEFLRVGEVNARAGVECGGRGVDFVLGQEVVGHGGGGIGSSLLSDLLVEWEPSGGLECREVLPDSRASCDARQSFKDCRRDGRGIDAHWNQSFVFSNSELRYPRTVNTRTEDGSPETPFRENWLAPAP